MKSKRAMSSTERAIKERCVKARKRDLYEEAMQFIQSDWRDIVVNDMEK